jgi:hypothetical protein
MGCEPPLRTGDSPANAPIGRGAGQATRRVGWRRASRSSKGRRAGPVASRQGSLPALEPCPQARRGPIAGPPTGVRRAGPPESSKGRFSPSANAPIGRGAGPDDPPRGLATRVEVVEGATGRGPVASRQGSLPALEPCPQAQGPIAGPPTGVRRAGPPESSKGRFSPAGAPDLARVSGPRAGRAGAPGPRCRVPTRPRPRPPRGPFQSGSSERGPTVNTTSTSTISSRSG